jgi:hypothetical protein
LLSGLVAPQIGNLIKKTGDRDLLVLGSILSALSLLILSISHGIYLWYVGWTILGLGMAFKLTKG